MANYYMLGGDGKEYGPVTSDQLRQWVAEGRANASTQIRSAEGGTWTPLGAVPELSGAGTTPPTAGMPASVFASPAGSPGQPMGPKPSNYLVFAILTTICCCPPFGIPAIVFAAQVDSKYASGNYAGAVDYSGKAKMWSWIALGAGILASVAYAIFVVAVSGSAGMRHY